MSYSKYLQVDLDFYDTINSCTANNKELKVFYFDEVSDVQDAKGFFKAIESNSEGEFLLVANKKVRLDRIITINGKIGPAYEEYDGLANACFSCMAGYEL